MVPPLSQWLPGRPARKSEAGPPSLVIITDPGPDPDDAKAILTAAMLHREGLIHLAGVVCNGGGNPRGRARLARCLLEHVRAHDVPVGVGSPGRPVEPKPHEYSLEGYLSVQESSLRCGPDLLLSILAGAQPQGLTVVCISSLRDLADAIHSDPDLACSRIKQVSIMGGLEQLPAAAASGSVMASGPQRWRPDSSVNNTFDMEAATYVYERCFELGIPMVVVNRNVVPHVHMQLARSFAELTQTPVMRYLADAQFLGLEGLWRDLCAGHLPKRCTKQWYFQTFCGVSPEVFEDRGLEALDAEAPIGAHLNGYVKPYDVVALMTAVPGLSDGLPALDHRHRGVTHRLLLDSRYLVPVSRVVALLRTTYHFTVLLDDSNDPERPMRLSVGPDQPVATPAPLGSPASGRRTTCGITADLAGRSSVEAASDSAMGHPQNSGSPMVGRISSGGGDRLFRPRGLGSDTPEKAMSREIRAVIDGPGKGSAVQHSARGKEGPWPPSRLGVVHRFEESLSDALRVGGRLSPWTMCGCLFFFLALTVVAAVDRLAMALGDEKSRVGSVVSRSYSLRDALYAAVRWCCLMLSLLGLMPVGAYVRATRSCCRALLLALLLDTCTRVPLLALLPAGPAVHLSAARQAGSTCVATFHLATCALKWQASAGLLRVLWRNAGLVLLFDATFATAEAVVLPGHSGPIYTARILLAIVLAGLILWPGFRMRVHDAAVRCTLSDRGQHLLVAPLIGFGAVSMRGDAKDLVVDAEATCYTIRLDDHGMAGVRSELLLAPVSTGPGSILNGRAMVAGGIGTASSPLSRKVRLSSVVRHQIGTTDADAGERAPHLIVEDRALGDLRVGPEALAGAPELERFPAHGANWGAGVATGGVAAVELESGPSEGSPPPRPVEGSKTSPPHLQGPPDTRWPHCVPLPGVATDAEGAEGGAQCLQGLGLELTSHIPLARSVSAARRSNSSTTGTGAGDCAFTGAGPRVGACGPDPATQPRSRPKQRQCRRLLPSTSDQGVDFFVSHCPEDLPRDRILALERWRQRVLSDTTQGGSSGMGARCGSPDWAPTIFFDLSCMDPRRTPEDHLAQRVVCLGRARKLVVLWGEKYTTNLMCVLDLCTWHALGRRSEDVEVVPVASAQEQLHTIISTVDAFHVNYPIHRWMRTPESAEVFRRLTYAVELAGAYAVNKGVTRYLPGMISAVINVRERIAQEEARDLHTELAGELAV